MTQPRIEATFIQGGCGRIFVLSRRPATDRGTAVLIVPPFGEEMNKSRKMLSDVAQQLARRGIATILPDLFGTGDSDGEFRDSDWDVWRSDVACASAWSSEQGWPVRGLLGVRTGCALAAQVARETLERVACTVFWQPVTDGGRFITQFLRLRVAASMMADHGKETTNSLRARLQAGETLEVAGYDLSPRLADQLEQIRLAASVGPWLGDVHWMEVVREPGTPVAIASREFIESACGTVEITSRTVAGEPFWSSTEIVRLPALAIATADAFACEPAGAS